jgi:hypothetical protein
VRKERNGKESLRRRKPTVGCNASRRRRRRRRRRRWTSMFMKEISSVKNVLLLRCVMLYKN